MITIDFRAANPAGSEAAQVCEPEAQALDLSFEQIYNRAFAKTEVLIDILDREERSCWNHGGLNE